MEPEHSKDTRGETFTYIKKCFCVCLCFLCSIFFAFFSLFIYILIERRKGGAHKDDDTRTKVFFYYKLAQTTCQNLSMLKANHL